jgi:hypothetical protein
LTLQTIESGLFSLGYFFSGGFFGSGVFGAGAFWRCFSLLFLFRLRAGRIGMSVSAPFTYAPGIIPSSSDPV